MLAETRDTTKPRRSVVDYLMSGDVTGQHLADLQEIPLADLRIDPHYQRPLNEKKSRQIAQRFEPASASALAVSRREDGSLWVMDGQHRLAAMRSLGHPLALCLVYQGLTLQQEATIFVECNTVRAAPRAISVFMARLAAGDRVALDIYRVLERLGLDLPERVERNQNHNKRRIDTIYSVSALDRIYALDGAAELELILTMLRRMWPESPDALTQIPIRGLHLVHRTYSKAGLWPSDFATRVAREPIERVTRLARNYTDFHGGSVHLNMARALVNVYNQGKHKKLPQLIGDATLEPAPYEAAAEGEGAEND